MAAAIFQPVYKMHRDGATAYYPQYPVPVIKVEVGFVAFKMPLYLLYQLPGLLRTIDIGFKNFDHFIQTLIGH